MYLAIMYKDNFFIFACHLVGFVELITNRIQKPFYVSDIVNLSSVRYQLYVNPDLIFEPSLLMVETALDTMNEYWCIGFHKC